MDAKKKKRANGTGSYGKKTINGIEYYTLTKTYPTERKTFYGKTKKEVDGKAQQYEIKNKKLKESSIQLMSFYNYSKHWLNDWRKKPIKENTYDYYHNLLENHIKDSKFGILQLKFLNKDAYRSEELASAFIAEFAQKHSKSSTDGLYSFLHQVSKFAYQNRDLGFDFMLNVSKMSESDVGHKKKKTTALTATEVRLLWKEMQRKNTSDCIINGKAGTYVYGINAYALVFCCFTGLRWGEISCLRWADIDFNNNFFRVSKQYVTVKNKDENIPLRNLTKETSPKTHKSNRIIPLCDQALEILSMIIDRFGKPASDNSLIFSLTEKPSSDSNANRLLKAMCKRAGITRVTAHELRHSFATLLLLEDEQNLYTVSDLLGHSSADVTYNKYIHIFEENKAKTMQLFSKMKMD